VFPFGSGSAGLGFFRGAEMKITALMLVLLISGCPAYKPVPQEEMVIRKTIEVPGMTQDCCSLNLPQASAGHTFQLGSGLGVCDE
jgi:hypothetical protein